MLTRLVLFNTLNLKKCLTIESSPQQELSFVNVGDPKGGDLNGYQRMLVHQLVKREFPDYMCYSRNDGSFLQVVALDPNRELEVF